MLSDYFGRKRFSSNLLAFTLLLEYAVGCPQQVLALRVLF
ncbi:hypothetical protein Pla175_17410 [Pirellulimonas nuda]|uniref:Uncharacterized protein n=1 Tax=Pirellulimonas nuda TaxID=2528009 RepID=A0A518DAC0_9BACT|nr:hypothetical protein Pla175_17410 [Pirellulimonas nuda]